MAGGAAAGPDAALPGPAPHPRRARRPARRRAGEDPRHLRPRAGDPRIDSRARYAYIVHYDPAEFAGLPLAGFEQALRAEGIEFGVSYPSLNNLELFREGRFGPRLREAAPPHRLRRAVSLPRAEAAAASTVWLAHPMLLAEPEDVLDIVRAISAHPGERGRRRAAAIEQAGAAGAAAGDGGAWRTAGRAQSSTARSSFRRATMSSQARRSAPSSSGSGSGSRPR